MKTMLFFERVIGGYFRQLLLLCSLYLIGQEVYAQSLVINEVMSSNSSILADEDGDYSDWIEIFNSSNQAIDLINYSLSDDANNLAKWSFPSFVLAPNSFMVVFASDKNRSSVGNELHTNFKIKASGETIYLSLNSSVQSTFTGAPIPQNKSMGAYPNGTTFYTILDIPTPGTGNQLPVGISDVLQFSALSGVVLSSDSLTIRNSNGNNTVRYTVDGSEPSANSPIFPTQGVALDASLFSTTQLNQVQMSLPVSHFAPKGSIPQVIALRAAAFDTAGKQQSKIYSVTYFNHNIADIPKGLPAMSLMIDPSDLTDYDSGLFVLGQFWDANLPNNSGNFFQKGRAWERPIHLEYFENGYDTKIKQDAGLRLHGYSSRTPPQKALRLYARSSYGTSEFNHDFFPNRSFDSYKRLTLKPFMASWSQYGAADYLSSNLARNFDVEYLSSKPITLYINGEYWGIYFLSERIDEHYLGDISGHIKDSIDLIEGWQGLVSEGNGRAYSVLTDAVINYDLSMPQHYAKVAGLMDIANFIDYKILQMFTVNYDWPQNNMKCWKPRVPGTKWRWIVFDGDAGYSGVNFDMFAHTLDSTSSDFAKLLGTQFFRQLMKNEQFKNAFFTRLDEVLQSSLNFDYTKDITAEINRLLDPHIRYQSGRFGRPTDVATWEATTSFIDRLLAQRGCNMMRNARKHFENAIVKNYCYNEDYIEADIQIFPNPTDGKFTLGIDSQIDFSGQLSVYSLVGQKVEARPIEVFYGINGYKIDLSMHRPGIYVVTVTGGTQKFNQRVVVH